MTSVGRQSPFAASRSFRKVAVERASVQRCFSGPATLLVLPPASAAARIVSSNLGAGNDGPRFLHDFCRLEWMRCRPLAEFVKSFLCHHTGECSLLGTSPEIVFGEIDIPLNTQFHAILFVCCADYIERFHCVQIR